jgi:hypothetical protein
MQFLYSTQASYCFCIKKKRLSKTESYILKKEKNFFDNTVIYVNDLAAVSPLKIKRFMVFFKFCQHLKETLS